MGSSALTGRSLALLVGVPIAFAIVLLFHGAPDPDDVYGSLEDEASRFTTVHVLGILFIALMGAALYLLVRDLPGPAAQVSRMAIVPFVVFYVAAEAIAGVATGVLVEHANDVPESERAGAISAVQELWDNALTADALFTVAIVAWVVAVIGAVVAYRRAGAPTGALVLLALSALVAYHAPPVGPIGLLCFAGAAILLARAQRSPSTA